jgi:hypothetical protein
VSLPNAKRGVTVGKILAATVLLPSVVSSNN